MNNVNQINMGPESTGSNQFDDISSLASQLFSSNPETQIGSSAAEIPFSMSPPWNLRETPAAHPRNTGASPDGIPSFDETQWAQILSGGNWGNWGT